MKFNSISLSKKWGEVRIFTKKMLYLQRRRLDTGKGSKLGSRTGGLILWHGGVNTSAKRRYSHQIPVGGYVYGEALLLRSRILIVVRHNVTANP